MNKDKNIKMAMMYSYLLARCHEHDGFTEEDIENIQDDKVSSCQIDLYKKIINMLANGSSYDEITQFIDDYTITGYELPESKKTYVKSKAKIDLTRRKMSFKGEDNYE